MFLELNKDYLKDMDITTVGHVIAILRHAKQVHKDVIILFWIPECPE